MKKIKNFLITALAIIAITAFALGFIFKSWHCYLIGVFAATLFHELYKPFKI